ncbi:MAG: hypothetical protein Kow0063_25620 [Anaerolineae bacterium]
MKYRLQGIKTLSIARFGCLLGWVITIIPSLTCGLLAWGLLSAAMSWLESWKQAGLDVFGFEHSIDLIELLQLQDLLATLQQITDRILPLLLALVIVGGVVGGALIALTLIMLAWGYNLLAWLTGGLEVELQEVVSPMALPATADEKPTSTSPQGRNQE